MFGLFEEQFEKVKVTKDIESIYVEEIIKEKRCGKCNRFKENCDCGRPFFNGKNIQLVTAKLEASFRVGATDVEAYIYADISTDSLHRYCVKYPEFRSRKEALKQVQILKAKMVISAILDDKDESGYPTPRAENRAIWLLETKGKNEYSK
jgi:hypothetical protein